MGNGGILSSFGLNSLDPVSNAVGRQRRETVRAFWAKEFKARRIFVSGSWNLSPRRFAIGIMHTPWPLEVEGWGLPSAKTWGQKTWGQVYFFSILAFGSAFSRQTQLD